MTTTYEAEFLEGLLSNVRSLREEIEADGIDRPTRQELEDAMKRARDFLAVMHINDATEDP